jgi:hypothetical protein
VRPVIKRRALLASLPAVALAGVSASAEQTKLTLGTAMEGGGVAVYGAALIDAIKSVDPTLEIRAVSTGGILENVSMLDSGELDIGLVFGEVAHELFMGIGRPVTKLKVICVMYSTPGMFAVRADSRFHRIADLKGRPVVWNGASSGLAVQARYVMDGLGLDIDSDFQAIYTERLSEGPPLVIYGKAAALWGGGLRWPGFVQMANSTRGVRFIAPTFAEIERTRAKYGFLKQFTVPAGLYPGQYDPIETIGSWSFIFARADLDDAIAYRLAKALYRIERASSLSRPLVETTAKNTLAAIPGLDVLQPGVLRFYKETELVK